MKIYQGRDTKNREEGENPKEENGNRQEEILEEEIITKREGEEMTQEEGLSLGGIIEEIQGIGEIFQDILDHSQGRERIPEKEEEVSREEMEERKKERVDQEIGVKKCSRDA